MWLGIGDALAAAVDAGQLGLLQAMYDEWPFFKGLLDLVEMVMAKADPRVTAMYDAKLASPELQVWGEWLAQWDSVVRARASALAGAGLVGCVACARALLRQC